MWLEDSIQGTKRLQPNLGRWESQAFLKEEVIGNLIPFIYIYKVEA